MSPKNVSVRMSAEVVENQPQERGDHDLWHHDPVLRTYAQECSDPLAGLGASWGSAKMRQRGALANKHTPELRNFDAGGRRLGEVDFHPAYHDLMTAGTEAGYSAIAWDGSPNGHLTHMGMVYMMSQVEPGVCCPMTMTYAAVPALRKNPDLAAIWTPKILSRHYDPSVASVAKKTGVTIGMAMTEKQGGSDVRVNSTRAEPDGDQYRLFGHKWFCSAPMSDGFLTLAQTKDGLTCFFVPRWLEDGSRNELHLMRLKDKLGNRANASAEIEYHGAFAIRLGEEGRGVPTIIEMVHHTRLDTAIAPAGLMKGALSLAHHWVLHRSAFQRRLVDQPLMRQLLSDLVLDWEGAVALACRVARSFDQGDHAFARIAVALAKFMNNKLCPRVTLEAMEALGGMGYVEESGAPLFYREAPLNSIWEGSGNIICLDILRSLQREDARVALVAALQDAKGGDRRYDAALAEWQNRWAKPEEAEARFFAEDTAVLLTAATLIDAAPTAVADAFIATRLEKSRGVIAGATSKLDTSALLARLGPDS